MIDWIYQSVARGVQPLLPNVIWRAPQASPTLYLTFDDGPTPTGTPRLLESFGRHAAKATFFLLGRNAASLPDLVNEVIAAGHAIGNHTFSHPDPWRTSRTRLVDELDRTDDLLRRRAGAEPRLVRPPYGHHTPGLADWCRARGQKVVLWDVIGCDFRSRATAERVADNVIRWARPGSVVLLHDNPAFLNTMLPALERIVAHFSDAGWRLDALDGIEAPNPS